MMARTLQTNGKAVASRAGLLQIRFLSAVSFAVFLGIMAAVPAIVSADPSPTGRTPKLIWTPERQAVWNRMRAENHPLWVQLQSNADRSGTPNARYADQGEWATVAFQVTGNPIYAAKAWDELSDMIGVTPNGKNFTRENFIGYVWMYDWLKPALTSSQRQQFLSMLNFWADLVLDRVPGVHFGTRTGDSDETTGHYFGLALLYVATADENPFAVDAINVPSVGGLDAAGTSRGKMRTAIRDYVRKASGGVWLESSQYNLGTLKLLLFGTEAVKTATRQDYFPELTQFLPDLARAQMHELTPDLRQLYQWGDEEAPRGTHSGRRTPLVGMLSGLLQGNPEMGPAIQGFWNDLSHAEMTARGFVLFNPYAAENADWRTAAGFGHYAPGMGFMYARDNVSSSGSFLGAHMATKVNVDHAVYYLSQFQLYRNHEWAITSPIGYGGSYGGNQGEHVNSMLIGGSSSMGEARGPVVQEFGPGGAYAYMVGATGGNLYWNDYWHPPQRYLHEWTRSLFYLPSTDQSADTIVVFDRVNAQDPLDGNTLDSYHSRDRERITGALARKQWIIHTPVRPALSPEAISWQTAKGQQVKIRTLLPRDQQRVVLDEKVDIDLNGTIQSGEKKFQVRVLPTTDRKWDTFLNVAHVSDGTVSAHQTLITSSGGEAEGALIERAGHADALVLFDAAPGADLPPTKTNDSGFLVNDPDMLDRIGAQHRFSGGFTVTWTASASATEVFILGADPELAWGVSVDGHAASSLAVSSKGVGRLVVSGDGSHQLVLSVIGSAPDTIGPQLLDVQASTVSSSGAAIRWLTNEPATSQVEYGTSSSYGSLSALDFLPRTSHLIDLAGLNSSTSYHFRVRSADAAGNTSQSSDQVFTTLAVGEEPAPDPGPSSTHLIGDVSSSSGAVVQTATVGVGALIFSDRSYYFTAFPSAYIGQEFIQTANNDKFLAGSADLSFTLVTNTAVYVAYDSGATQLPGWLGDGSWTATGEVIETTDKPYKLYVKSFAAGSVALGGNLAAPASGASSSYFVIAVAAAGPEPAPEPAPEPVPNPEPAPEDGPTAGLISIWHLEEAAGAMRLDSFGPNHLGNDALVQQVPGIVGMAAQFDPAAGGYLHLDDASNLLLGGGSFTLAAWIYPSQTDAFMTAVSKYGGVSSQQEFLLSLERGKMSFILREGSGVSRVVTHSQVLNPNTWYLAMAWYDADKATLNIQIDNAASAVTTGVAPSAVTTAPFYVGATAFSGSTPSMASLFWSGRVDELRAWRRVLTDSERASLLDGGSVPAPIPDPAPGQGSLITDIQTSSGKAYQLAMVEVNAPQYIDRNYKITAFPAAYSGEEFIQTANGDKNLSGSSDLNLTLSGNATVYVAYDSRATSLPTWLNDGTWSMTGDMIATTDVPLRLYAKAFAAGPVVLGGNRAAPSAGASSNYIVAAIPGGSPAPEPEPKPQNQRPTLTPVPDQQVTEVETVSFIVSASDPDGDALIYGASGLPAGASFSGQTFSWATQRGDAGIHSVVFTVSDGSLTDSISVAIAVAALPIQTETLDVEVVRLGSSLVSSPLVSQGIPFAQGMLLDGSRLAVVYGGQEIPVAAQVLALWPQDGSVRSLLVQFPIPMSNNTASVTLVWGAPRTLADLQLTTVSWDVPEAFIKLPASWLAASGVIGEQVPMGEPGFEAYDANIAQYYPQRRDDAVVGDIREDGYYDITHVFYQLYVRSGDPEIFKAARREALHYRDNEIILSGPDRGRHVTYVKPRYIYLQGMADDYLLTGDPRTLEVAGYMAEYLKTHMDPAGAFYPQEATHFWTERFWGFTFMGVLTYYELTGDPAYRALADQYMENLYRTQLEWPQRGGFIHNLYSHDPTEGARPDEYGGSPFMTGLALETVVKYHQLTGSVTAEDSIVRALSWLINEGLADGGKTFRYLTADKYLVGAGPVDVNLLIAHAFGYGWRLTGDAHPEFLEVGRRIFDYGVANAYLGTRKHFNQNYRSSGHFLAYIQGAPNGGAPLPLVSAITTSTGKTYELGTLAVTRLAYTDRSFTFTAVSTPYLGAAFIRTANDDKTVKATNHLRFTLGERAAVYIAYDSRATNLADWLEDGSWTSTFDLVYTTDVGLRLYRKVFAAGEVVLGGNRQGTAVGAGSDYLVVVIPE